MKSSGRPSSAARQSVSWRSVQSLQMGIERPAFHHPKPRLPTASPPVLSHDNSLFLRAFSRRACWDGPRADGVAHRVQLPGADVLDSEAAKLAAAKRGVMRKMELVDRERYEVLRKMLQDRGQEIAEKMRSLRESLPDELAEVKDPEEQCADEYVRSLDFALIEMKSHRSEENTSD